MSLLAPVALLAQAALLVPVALVALVHILLSAASFLMRTGELYWLPGQL